MPSATPAPKRAKLFDSLVLELTIPLRLTFNLFDFPLAQRWASLVWAYQDGGQRPWVTGLPEPHRLSLQEEIDFLLQLLCEDATSLEQIRKLEMVDGAYSVAAIEQIRNLPLFQFHRESAPDSYQEFQLGMLERKLASLEAALKKKRKIRLTGIPVFPRHLIKLAVQPFENGDFAHFTNERLSGGLRLRPENGHLSAITCAESTDIGRMHTPARYFGPGFRIDLSPTYPPAEKWETHQNLLAWASANNFDMKDPRSWAECVYVARLCEEDRNRLEEIAQAFARVPEFEVSSVTLVPAKLERAKIEFPENRGGLKV